MTWPPPNRHAAALAVAVALAAGVALIATSGGEVPRVEVARPPAATPPSNMFPHTPAGAATAATAWCQDTTAFFDGTLESVVNALATGTFRVRVERDVRPASDMVHSRLLALHTPYLARIWPLGYAVEQYSPAFARVRVWQTYVLAAAGPEDMSGFQTTAVSLQWTDGTWKITSSPSGPDLAPPSPRASVGQVVSWITSVDQLHAYTYAP